MSFFGDAIVVTGIGWTGLQGAIALGWLLFLPMAAISPQPQTQAHHAQRQDPPQACSDFLADWELKPDTLRFETCKTVRRLPGRGIVATYRLRGADAAAMETFLRDRFGMAPLRFECCGWVPRRERNGDRYPGAGTFTHNGAQFDITLQSMETVVTERAQWSTIPTFHVRVETYWGF